MGRVHIRGKMGRMVVVVGEDGGDRGSTWAGGTCICCRLSMFGAYSLPHRSYLLDGSLPLYCRERRSGSYLTFCADAGSLLAKVVSSKSCASWVVDASVEAYRRHCDFEACAIDPVCTLKRLRNEAVTSCNAISMLYLLHLTSSHYRSSLTSARRTAASAL